MNERVFIKLLIYIANKNITIEKNILIVFCYWVGWFGLGIWLIDWCFDSHLSIPTQPPSIQHNPTVSVLSLINRITHPSTRYWSMDAIDTNDWSVWNDVQIIGVGWWRSPSPKITNKTKKQNFFFKKKAPSQRP